LTWAEDPFYIPNTTFKAKLKCGPAIHVRSGQLMEFGWDDNTR
jgi:hypothetical protein